MIPQLDIFVTYYGLSAIFVLMTLESLCIPIPSEVVMSFAGYLVYRGHLPLLGVIVIATLANLVGSWLAYLIGVYGGRAFILRWGRYVLLNEAHLQRAETWFARHGSLSVCIGRVLPGVRTFISLPAGIGRMPLARFFLFSAIGSWIWNTALTVFGYQLGKHWELVDIYLKPLTVLGAVVLIAGVLWYWFGRSRTTRRHSARQTEHRP
ncbi:DedA family protein [Alicyclobacillus shizuokensis]|uniref:DedA family protein n=1 Tax=Alicyclobacillus shizuokensis TaxID=392014 RepID=UPI0008376F99|nr:DedA family protein [Alicyclobacillus shizuokensis]MCL6625460.1 DedA family protein [Alicyclobacillus shizuokensis]